MLTNVLLLLAFLCLLVPTCLGCEIHGTDSGVCTKRYLPDTYGEGLEAISEANKQWMNGTAGDCSEGQGDHCMPFCGVYIANYYPPCVPLKQVLPRDQNFEDGRHHEHTTRNKDRWIQDTATAVISGNSEMFRGNRDCQEAYKRYLCWNNFPRCDEDERSLPMCSSVCENFFRACGFDSELYSLCSADADREEGTTKDVNGWLMSTFFPGQPFVLNKVIPRSRGEPALVCTPSIKNAAKSNLGMTYLIWSTLLLSSAFVIISG